MVQWSGKNEIWSGKSQGISFQAKNGHHGLVKVKPLFLQMSLPKVDSAYARYILSMEMAVLCYSSL